MPLLLLVPSVVVTLWLAGFIATSDLAVPLGTVSRFRNVLAVFPHADDETVNCGGTLRRFSTAGAAVTLLLLTGGERGNPAGVPDAALKRMRSREAEGAVRRLGLSRLIQQDFGDGQLADRREEIWSYLVETIREIGPDLVVTYDRAGLDGHPDHVLCAEILTELKTQHLTAATLWYVALPKRVVRLLQTARQLPRQTIIDERRAIPTLRIFLGTAVIAKIRAWYGYRSQRGAIGKGLGRFVPIWFAISTLQFEYFTEVE